MGLHRLPHGPVWQAITSWLNVMPGNACSPWKCIYERQVRKEEERNLRGLECGLFSSPSDLRLAFFFNQWYSMNSSYRLESFMKLTHERTSLRILFPFYFDHASQPYLLLVIPFQHLSSFKEPDDPFGRTNTFSWQRVVGRATQKSLMSLSFPLASETCQRENQDVIPKQPFHSKCSPRWIVSELVGSNVGLLLFQSHLSLF